MAKQIGNGTASEEPLSPSPHGVGDPASAEPSRGPSHVRAAPDVALLYRLDSPRPIPAGALPAPHLDLVPPSDIEATSRALAIFFPPANTGRARGESLYAVRFFCDRAEIVVHVDSALGANCTIPDLVGQIPAINSWLTDWSDAPDRCPPLDPPWALAMGFDEATMRAIANGIAHHLAAPNETAITIRDTGMCKSILCIPARAQLRARKVSSRKSPQDVEVARVEMVDTATTPGGEKVLLHADGTATPTTPTIQLDPTTFRRASVSVPMRLKVIRPHHLQGVPRHD